MSNEQKNKSSLSPSYKSIFFKYKTSRATKYNPVTQKSVYWKLNIVIRESISFVKSILMEFGCLPIILFQAGGKNVNILKFYSPLILFPAGIGGKKGNIVKVYIPLALFQVKIWIWPVCKCRFSQTNNGTLIPIGMEYPLILAPQYRSEEGGICQWSWVLPGITPGLAHAGEAVEAVCTGSFGPSVLSNAARTYWKSRTRLIIPVNWFF